MGFGDFLLVVVMTVANLKSKLLIDVMVSDNEFDAIALKTEVDPVVISSYLNLNTFTLNINCMRTSYLRSR